MSYDLVADGQGWNADDFYDFGWLEEVENSDGVDRIRLIAMLFAVMKDFGRVMYGTATAQAKPIATGSVTLTLDQPRPFVVGAPGMFIDSDNITNSIAGQITAYDGTHVTINGELTSGGGSPTNWSVVVTGPRGPAGTASVTVKNRVDATIGTRPILRFQGVSASAITLTDVPGSTLVDIKTNLQVGVSQFAVSADSVTAVAASPVASVKSVDQEGRKNTLPAANAAGMYNGWWRTIANRSQRLYTVCNDSGKVLALVPPGFEMKFECFDVSTAAGKWKITGNDIKSAAPLSLVMDGGSPPNSTVNMVVNQSSGYYAVHSITKTTGVMLFRNGTTGAGAGSMFLMPFSHGPEGFEFPSGGYTDLGSLGFTTSTQISADIALIPGSTTKFLLAAAVSNSGPGYAMQVAVCTLTFVEGTAQLTVAAGTKYNTGSTTSGNTVCAVHVEALDATVGMMITNYSDAGAADVRVFDYDTTTDLCSGTTSPNLGGGTGVFTGGGAYTTYRIVNLSSTLLHIYYDDTVRRVTRVGKTLTNGANTTVKAGATIQGLSADLTNQRVLGVYTYTDGKLYAEVMTDNGATIAVAETLLGRNPGGATKYPATIQLKNGRLITGATASGADNGQLKLGMVFLDGTAVTWTGWAQLPVGVFDGVPLRIVSTWIDPVMKHQWADWAGFFPFMSILSSTVWYKRVHHIAACDVNPLL